MLVSEAIQSAYREANITVIGTTPTAAQLAEGLTALNVFRVKLFGSEFGENLEDWLLPPPSSQSGVPDGLVSPNQGSTWYLNPRVNSRLLVKLTAATTVYFPENPTDGSRMATVDVGSSSVDLTLNGNGRLIEGEVSQVDTVQALAAKQWFYRGDIASWEPVTALALGDSLPLPQEYDDLFITYLAIRLSPRNGEAASDDTKLLYTTLMKQAKARYRQTQAVAVNEAGVGESMQSTVNGVNGWFA